MKTFFTILFCAALILTGCDSVNVAHYRIVGVEADSHNADKIKSIVRMAAHKTGMTNEISNSLIPNTVAIYGGGGKYPIIVGAYFCGSDVYIDLEGEFGPHMSNFQSAQRHLVRAFAKEFGTDFQTLGTYATNSCRANISIFPLAQPSGQ